MHITFRRALAGCNLALPLDVVTPKKTTLFIFVALKLPLIAIPLGCLWIKESSRCFVKTYRKIPSGKCNIFFSIIGATNELMTLSATTQLQVTFNPNVISKHPSLSLIDKSAYHEHHLHEQSSVQHSFLLLCGTADQLNASLFQVYFFLSHRKHLLAKFAVCFVHLFLSHNIKSNIWIFHLLPVHPLLVFSLKEQGIPTHCTQAMHSIRSCE